MSKFTRSVLGVFMMSMILSCVIKESASVLQAQNTNISPTDPRIRVVGRATVTTDSVGIYWSGTSITFRVNGGEVKADLRDERGQNYFNLIIDGRFHHYIKLDSGRKTYTLIDGLSQGTHQVELIKRNEWDKGETWFYGLVLDDVTLAPLAPPAGRIIEFFGNSITAGYAIDDTTGGDSPEGIFTNNYPTYASLTARHFKADLYCTVKSGIGVTISWFDLIMPELYNRCNPSDPTSRWDFRKVQPQVVVINLLQNDSWLVKMNEHPSFKKRFRSKAPDGRQLSQAYQNFVRSIRGIYPNASIICALGSMDATKPGSPYPRYVEDAVNGLNDNKVYTLFFPFTGKAGHPRRDDNKKMAELLIDFIDKHIEW